MVAQRELKVKDIGRPKAVTIPIPEDGGVVLLTGENGVGKSTTLEAVQDGLTNRKDKRSRPRDGVASGSLNGCGIKMTVGRKITRTGELTVETLDGGRLSIADVVSPPYKGAEEADGRRIKALVQLAGVEADFVLFKDIHRFADQIVSPEAMNADDILVMADKIKRDFEAEARKAEGRRDIAKQQALACEEAVRGVSLNVQTDAGILQLQLEEAVRRGQELISAARTARERNSEILSARQKITELTLNRDGRRRLTLDEARHDETVAHNSANEANEAVRDLEQRLMVARHNQQRANDKWRSAKDALRDAESFAETLAELEQSVSAGEMVVPSDSELADADEAITAARKAIEAGSAARAAREKLRQAEMHREKEAAAEEEAERLRSAAAGVDQVLTDQIATLGSPLRVEAGRLVTDTDRGPTFFADLSDGERWRMATEIAVKAVGPNGMLTIPQAAWSELSPKNRLMIDNLARSGRVVILSAIATDDPEIDAVPFEAMEVAGV